MEQRQTGALVLAQPKTMMIKNLCPGLQEVGKIKIGNKGKVRQSGGGKEWQPPQKLDHFLITTLERGSDGNFILDEELHRKFGEKPKSIPVRLIYDDIALNFPTRYICYYGKKVFCSGDGESAQRLQRDGTYTTVCCPCDRQDPKYGGDDGKNGPDCLGGGNGKGKCKINGILSAIIDGANTVGGVWKFRTTSYNTVVGIISSLALITRITGGRLAGIPLDMRVTPKTVQDPIQGSQQTVYVVSLTYKGDVDALRSTGYQIAMDEVKHGISMRDIEQQALMLISHAPSRGLGDDSDLDVVEEFYPEEAATIVVETVQQGVQEPLFGDTGRQQEEVQPRILENAQNPPQDAATQAPTYDPATHHPSGRERGKPGAGRSRRNAAELEEDRLADERDQQAAAAANGNAPSEETETVQQQAVEQASPATAPEPAAQQAAPAAATQQQSAPMEDLF